MSVSVRMMNSSSKLTRKRWILHILIIMKLGPVSFLIFNECWNIAEHNTEGSNGNTKEMHVLYHFSPYWEIQGLIYIGRFSLHWHNIDQFIQSCKSNSNNPLVTPAWATMQNRNQWWFKLVQSTSSVPCPVPGHCNLPFPPACPFPAHLLQELDFLLFGVENSQGLLMLQLQLLPPFSSLSHMLGQRKQKTSQEALTSTCSQTLPFRAHRCSSQRHSSLVALTGKRGTGEGFNSVSTQRHIANAELRRFDSNLF